MESVILSLVIVSFFTLSLPQQVEPARPNSQITVMGVEVKIDCKFKAISPRTAEEISFSVNRTTNRLGVYKLEIPSVEGIECAGERAVSSVCQASLMWTSSSKCNVPGYKTTSNQISIKSRQANLCIYSLNAMSYRPTRRSKALCGN
ncbi:hypothetical protein Nepgr_026255 [Nepenthes gracilis]|uniref:Uncharacterized protein n=1 Tax=Nepenthes gracilis TaxID=150966 RepID=A0AAD3T7V9_NEPGR|nr:hypothetical protein Nepgr_026255 [Nepenthes gracilis]